MARIRVLEAIAGADFSWAPGDVVDVSDEEAAGWADGHRAVLADHEPAQQVAGGSRIPRVIDEDGLELEVLDAVEDIEPPDGQEDGLSWSRWSVTVRRPAPAASGGGESPVPVDPADLENEEPANEDGQAPAAAFDPREHTNKEVLAYLDTVGEQEALRVLNIEASEGENRAGIAKNREAVLEAARARDAAAGGQLQAEKAADFSRGGGSAETPETRDW
ncbi:hypothetical protein [Streptomyces sediminimaris]|uniref:hypothetical protein n=1 Tax=Streptomyces sediminimaris TaxID=3383721 RepID=UPI00399A1E7C